MRIYFFTVLFLLVILLTPQKVLAESSYVLPYPAAMPGSVWYKIDLVKEKINGLWSYGDFGKFYYNLGQSDKYLVEAKTLFEYKQYLLAYNSLLKSDQYFQNVKPSLAAAASHGKNTLEKEVRLGLAAQKHAEVLSELKNEVPNSFLWTPEKEKPTSLDLGRLIDNSINIRTQK